MILITTENGQPEMIETILKINMNEEYFFV